MPTCYRKCGVTFQTDTDAGSLQASCKPVNGSFGVDAGPCASAVQKHHWRIVAQVGEYQRRLAGIHVVEGSQLLHCVAAPSLSRLVCWNRTTYEAVPVGGCSSSCWQR